MSHLMEDYNLGSEKIEARKLFRQLRRSSPKYRWQFSQHAPDGYDRAYSAQAFQDYDKFGNIIRKEGK
jgi:hypothetical protein